MRILEAGEFLRPLFLGAPDTVRCTPDSPVNYTGAPLEFPEGDEFELESSGAPDTVRWHTGQSGAPDQGSLRFLLSKNIVNFGIRALFQRFSPTFSPYLMGAVSVLKTDILS